MQILVKKPCSASWEDMQASARGRLCTACHKEVVDFTAMTDEELIRHMAPGSEKVCGRFLPHQTGRDLVQPRRTYKWTLAHGWQWLFLLLLFHNKSEAQKGKVSTVQTPPTDKKLIGDTVDMGIPILLPPFVVVRVTDAAGHPVPGAVVTITNKNNKAVTNPDGQAVLTYPQAERRISLSVAAVGFETKSLKVRLKANETETEVSVTLRMVQVIVGGATLVD